MRIVKPVTGFICALTLIGTSLAPAAQADQRDQRRGEARGDRDGGEFRGRRGGDDRGDRAARKKVDRFLGGDDVRKPRAPIPARDPRGPGDFDKRRDRRGDGNRGGRGYSGDRDRDYRGDRDRDYRGDRGRGYGKGDRGGYNRGYGGYGKGYSRPHTPRYHSPRYSAHRPYYAPRRYDTPKRYVAPRYVAPRYVAPRYYAPKRAYRPVYRSYSNRYRIGHYYTYHPRTVILTDYHYYGLYDPPYGYHWVRDHDSDDVILASVATGAIIGLAVGLLSSY